MSLPSSAERIALVIGNDKYQVLPTLQKAVNDARAMSAALSEIGFTVFLGENLSRRETNRKLSDFESAISPGDEVFFFICRTRRFTRGGKLPDPR